MAPWDACSEAMATSAHPRFAACAGVLCHPKGGAYAHGADERGLERE